MAIFQAALWSSRKSFQITVSPGHRWITVQASPQIVAVVVLQHLLSNQPERYNYDCCAFYHCSMLGQVQSLAIFQSSMKSVLCTIIWAAYRQDKVTEVDGSVSSRPALKTKWKRRVEQVQNWLKLLQWLPRNQKIGQMHRIQIFSQQPQCRVQVVLEVTQKFRERLSWSKTLERHHFQQTGTMSFMPWTSKKVYPPQPDSGMCSGRSWPWQIEGALMKFTWMFTSIINSYFVYDS